MSELTLREAKRLADLERRVEELEKLFTKAFPYWHAPPPAPGDEYDRRMASAAAFMEQLGDDYEREPPAPEPKPAKELWISEGHFANEHVPGAVRYVLAADAEAMESAMDNLARKLTQAESKLAEKKEYCDGILEQLEKTCIERDEAEEKSERYRKALEEIEQDCKAGGHDVSRCGCAALDIAREALGEK